TAEEAAQLRFDDPFAIDLALSLRLERWPSWKLSFDRVNHLGNGLRDQVRAVEEAHRTTELDPSHPFGWWKRSTVELGAGRIAGARASLERYRDLRNGREQPSGLYMWGGVLMAQGEREEARRAFVRAGELPPRADWWWSPVQLGLAHL